jgi:hypothetical protein
MAEKVPNPKFQIPGNLQIANSKVAATLSVGVWRLGFPWSLGFGIWNFLIFN